MIRNFMPVTAIILSGGLATRMGGIDKGLVELNGKSLVQHVIERLSKQTEEILINANREIVQYQHFGYPVLQDETADFIGPLAGFSLGLQHARHEYLLTVPCDSPLIPVDLSQRLLAALTSQNADIAVATSEGDAHPVFSLCKRNVLPSLTAYLAQGGRKVSAWQKQQAYVEVDFSDQAEAFVNLNTLHELDALALKLNHE
jgi:molybdopterin-guanine dinucleotide biosynthesis protein A